MKRPSKSLRVKKILFFFALFISLHAGAQNYASSGADEPNLKFGVIDASSLSIEQILGNPKLNCKESNCQVIGYTLRIGLRGYHYFGPYYVKGAELPQDVKDIMDHMDILRGYLYFEDIRVKCDGKEKTLSYEYALRYYR